MASQSAAEPFVALSAIVRGWDRQWRTRRFVAALPKVALPGVVVGLVLAIVARIGPYIPELTIALIAAAVVLLGVLIAALWVFGRGRSLMLAARRFDRMLEMQERVSTAFELLEGRIQASAQMAELQIRDAFDHASAVYSPRAKRQPSDAGAAPDKMRQQTRISRRALILVLVLLLILAVLLLLVNPNSSQAADDARTASSIEAAGQTLRQIAADTMTDPNLEIEDRQALLQSIEESLLALAQPDVSREEALAAVSDAEQSLQSLADRMSQEQRSSRQAAAEAAQSLRSLGEEPRIDPFAELGEQLAQLAAPPGDPGAETIDPAALEQAASALQNSPDEAMQQAADNLQQAAADAREGDPPAAQEQIQQAAEQLREAQQQNERRQQAAQGATQQAQQAQQAGEQLRDQQDPQASQSDQNAQDSAGGESPQGQQESMFDQQGTQDTQGGQGEQQLDSPQGGQQNDSGSEDVSGTGQENSGSSSDTSGSSTASGAQGQSTQPQDSQQPSQGAQESEGSGGVSSPSAQSQSAGAGDLAGDSGQVMQGNPLTDASNNPDGSGQRDYEAVYAPQRIGGSLGADEIFLQAEDQSAPSVEGEFARNPEGNSTVPYNRVFSNYANAVSRALDNGYIPLGLRDVVRQYFSALEPSN